MQILHEAKLYNAVCLLLKKLILILFSTQDLKARQDFFPQASLTFKDIYFHDLWNQSRL